MRILVACEFSGVVRDAFRARGHDAWSCDLLPSEVDGPHIQGDVFEAISSAEWDMMIAFPPCTYLTRAGDRWHADSPQRFEAAKFVQRLFDQPSIPRIAIENPRGALNRCWRRPDQMIQPWMFGIGEKKATCLWLKGLPPLLATVVHTDRRDRVHRNVGPGPERWKIRSRTLPGIAAAMAAQWG